MTDTVLTDLLEKTSRTFALSIPMLPSPTDRDVTIAYLLFRIADTFEDAVYWPAERSTRALADLAELIAAESSDNDVERVTGWLDDPPPDDNPDYFELLEHAPTVLDALRSLDRGGQEILRRHLLRTVVGMAGFVRQGREIGRLQLPDLPALREYCYYVAGIVGEMLTDLFIYRHRELAEVAAGLRCRAAAFGEGLQLVNILKDSAHDAEEGRSYLPPTVERAEVFALARRDLEAAAEYTRLLQKAGAARGLVASNALPVLLARGTLDGVEADGAGAKLTRDEVFTAIQAMNEALDEGRPVV